MIDEKKLAEEYFKSVCEDYNEEKERTGERHYWVGYDIKNAFLAGLKAGKPQWHDLRENHTDVPKENVTVLLLTEVEPVTARYDNEYEAFFRLGDKLDYCVFIAPMSYIAWCEIPKFKENE